MRTLSAEWARLAAFAGMPLEIGDLSLFCDAGAR
jgi:hypothetical protein